MYKANHFIQRQVLEIETPDAAAGLGFQQEVRNVFYEKLMPQLETIFDEAVKGNQLISIEYLPVNIEIEDIKNWQHELVQKAMQQISLALRESPKIPINIEQTPSSEKQIRYSLMDDFFYFLERGYLRWNASVQSLSDFETSLKKDFLLFTTEEKSKLSGKLLAVLSENNNSVQRLSCQFSKLFIQTLIDDEILIRALENWTIHFKELNNRYFFLQVLIKTWIKKKSNPVFTRDEILLMQTLLENIINNAGMQDWYQQQLSPTRTFIHKVLNKDFDTIIYPEKQNNESAQNGTVFKNNQQSEKENTSPLKETEEDCFYIDNAGLIIAHVFLKNFFESTGLWENKMFIDEAAHQRVVLLTAYLVNEETEFPEYNLLLNKILCGFPVEQSLPLTIDITGQEKMESAELLQAIINNWKYKGRAVCTTIENLRGSFLRRNGKITKTNNGWLLQAEQHGYDILLSGLPWGIGTIKLPWMENILHVEWI